MYPILYRKKTGTSFCIALLLFALSVRLLCLPVLRTALWEEMRNALGGETFFRLALFLETGMLPQKQSASGQPAPFPSAPQQTEASVSASTQPVAETQSAASTQPPETAQPSESVPSTSEPARPSMSASTPFTEAEAEAIRFRGNCTYQVDKTELLLRPLRWKQSSGPKLLILHSHSCESYTQTEGHTYVPDANYRTLDLSNSVVAVGDALTEALGALGVEVIHDRTYNDYPDYNRSYAVAREKIQTYLEQYPSITMVIDLHRDALDKPVREKVAWEGQTLAPLMLVVGTDEGGLSHPHWEDNLSCALKLQALGNRELPGLFKNLSFRRERFNEDLTPGSLIVEVGSTENTLPEALASMPYLARWVAELLNLQASTPLP